VRLGAGWRVANPPVIPPTPNRGKMQNTGNASGVATSEYTRSDEDWDDQDETIRCPVCSAAEDEPCAEPGDEDCPELEYWD
jgi:hypothetical protein